MKKLFALLAVVLAVVSCQKDADGLDVNVGGDIAKISVALPDDAITRAGGTDSAKGGLTNTSNEVVRVILQVYYNGEASSERLVEYLGDGETVANFDVRLVPDRVYTFVAWADQVVAEADEDLYYNTKNLKAVTMMPRTWSAMDERRDAYTHTMTKTFTASANLNMTLTRPFAKLRIKTTDMQHLRKVGIEPTTATISYTTKHYTTFNAFAGEAVDKENAGVAHEYTIATYSNETGNEKTLYADYFFASAEEEVINFTFAVRDQKGEQIKQNTFNTSIPVKRNHLTTIAGNILTENNNFDVTLDERFDGAYVKVEEAAYAQSELDNAIANTTIYLEPGVNYGVLYLRPAGAPTKEVDWIGNNYRYETYSLFENLTIVGAEGATVDAIKIEGGTYYNTAHSQSDKYPVMLSLIELKNVVFDGVTFTGKGGYDPEGHGNAVNLSGSNIKVDGLTFKNCVLNNDENDARLLYKTESTTRVHTYTYNGETYTFTPSLKNITITDCTLNGGYMGLELREAENVTITNNEFNVNDRNILLPVNSGCTYSGNVTITGNVSNNAKERFVRMSGAGDATVVIKDNIIKNYQGADPDYIKVTDGTYVTIENNYVVAATIDNYDAFIEEISDDTWYDATKTELTIEDVADFAAFIETANSIDNFEGKTIKLTGDIDLYFKDVTALADGDPATFRPIGDVQYGQVPFKGTFDGQGHTIRNLYQNGWDLGYDWYNYGSYGLFGTLEDATVKNVVIEGSESYIEGGNVAFIAGCAKGDCVFENIEIKSGVAATYNNRCGSIIGWSGDEGNYTFKNITIGKDVVLGGLWGSFDSSIGGIVGQAKPSPSATYTFENITINCRIDAYNDCTAAYDYYNYRMCGMIIGRCAETTTIDGKNYPDLSKYNLSFNNVVVNYGDWMNYHYCRRSGESAVRIEPGYSYGGAENRDHSGDNVNCMECIPFDQLIGGDQYAVKGLREVTGVTVNYPASYVRGVSNYAELKKAIAAGISHIALESDITVDEWVMFSEDRTIGNGDIITIDEINLTIDGNGHTLTINDVESAGNGGYLFQGASVLNISNLTIKYADGLTTGGLGMHSGVIKNVRFVGGGYAILPGDGEIKVENCTFATKQHAIYFEEERDNLTVTGCTFNQATYAIILRGDVKFTDNIINNGNVTVRSGSPVITGNNFYKNRFKVYGAATATISNNTINNLVFDGSTYASTFTNNTLSAEAQAALNAATKVI